MSIIGSKYVESEKSDPQLYLTVRHKYSSRRSHIPSRFLRDENGRKCSKKKAKEIARRLKQDLKRAQRETILRAVRERAQRVAEDLAKRVQKEELEKEEKARINRLALIKLAAERKRALDKVLKRPSVKLKKAKGPHKLNKANGAGSVILT